VDDEPTLVRPRPSPDVDDEPTLVRPRPSPDVDDEPTLVRPRPSPDVDDEPTLVRPRPSPDTDDDAATTRRTPKAEEDQGISPVSEDAETRWTGKQEPEPDWIKQQRQLPPGSVVIDADPTNPAKALDDYRARVIERPDLEVGIYRNTETGQYIVVQGDAINVFVGTQRVVDKNNRWVRDAKGNIVREKIAPQRGGVEQGWKRGILGQDVGDWELVIHFHPTERGGDVAGMTRRLPSGNGGDMTVVHVESQVAGDMPRRSRIEYLEGNGKFGHTDFGYDPGLKGGPFWVDHADPITGARTKVKFATIKDYHDYFEFVTGRKLLDSTARTSAPPSAPEPRPDDFVFFHGTSQEGQTAMERDGIISQRKSGDPHDFGAGFYVTPQEDVAGLYATDRTTRDKGTEKGPVLKFRVAKSDMGVVVDIRPQGEFGAQWQAYLDSPSPYFATPGSAKMYANSALPRTMGHFIDSLGYSQKGRYFEQFLKSIGMTHADAIYGPLGTRGTTGIGSGREGAEQIAIRSQRLANLLTEQLPGRTAVPQGGIVPAAGPTKVGTATRPVPTDDPAPAVAKAAPAEEPAPDRPVTTKPVAEDDPKAPTKPIVDPEIDAHLERIFPPDGPRPVTDPSRIKSLGPAAMEAAAKSAAARNQERRRVFAMEPAVMERHLPRLDAGTATIDETVDAFRKARQARDPRPTDAQVDADVKALRTVLEDIQTRKAAEFVELQKAMRPVVDGLKIGPALKAIVMDSPILLEMVHRNPDLAQKRLQRMAGRYRGKNFTASRFEEGWDAYYTANQLPATSEMDAMFQLGVRGLDIVKGGGKANKHGIDIIAIEHPPATAKDPTKAKIHLIDDKALDTELLGSVTALTEHLEKNLRKDAAAFDRILADRKASGATIDPVHQHAVKQLQAAADELKLLRAKYPGGDKVWQNADYAKAVRQMLEDKGIDLWITGAHGKVERLSALLGNDGYGFQIIFNQYGAVSAAPPPPPPPPPP